MSNLKNKRNGITLIALVVTIIVLLILAVVSFKIITGDDGILNKAEVSASETERAKAKEQAELWIAEKIADYYAGSRSTTLVAYLGNLIGDTTGVSVGEYTIKKAASGSAKVESIVKVASLEGAYATENPPEATLNIEVYKGEFKMAEGSVGATGKVAWESEISSSGSGGGTPVVTTYTVSFYKESGDNVAYATKTVSEGGTVGENMPADPTKAETETSTFEFAGWKVGTSTFDGNTVIDSDMSVYADWTEAAKENYVGYYIKKGEQYGIIYVDLLGEKNFSSWAIGSSASVQASATAGKTFKSYTITDTKYTDPKGCFGTNYVIEVAEDNTGDDDRFIAMALNDTDNDKHTWWNWFREHSYNLETSIEIGSGRSNSEKIKLLWDENLSGQNTKSDYTDVWSLVTLNDGFADWFIPSINELIAFCGMTWTDHSDVPELRNITYSNYRYTYDLCSDYVSSSQHYSNYYNVNLISFSNRSLKGWGADENLYHVRLSTTY